MRKDSLLQNYYYSKLPKAKVGMQTGDPNQPYHPITNPEGYKTKISDVLKVSQKRAQEANDSRPQIKQGHKELPYEKKAREERLRKEAQENSALAQTMGLFTPSGSNPAAGAIGAETFTNMNPLITGPMMSTSRLYGAGRSLIDNKTENPYFGSDKGMVGNVLGGLNLAGDIGMLRTGLRKPMGSFNPEPNPASRIEWSDFTERNGRVKQAWADAQKRKAGIPATSSDYWEYLKNLEKEKEAGSIIRNQGLFEPDPSASVDISQIVNKQGLVTPGYKTPFTSPFWEKNKNDIFKILQGDATTEGEAARLKLIKDAQTFKKNVINVNDVSQAQSPLYQNIHQLLKEQNIRNSFPGNESTNTGNQMADHIIGFIKNNMSLTDNEVADLLHGYNPSNPFTKWSDARINSASNILQQQRLASGLMWPTSDAVTNIGGNKLPRFGTYSYAEKNPIENLSKTALNNLKNTDKALINNGPSWFDETIAKGNWKDVGMEMRGAMKPMGLDPNNEQDVLKFLERFKADQNVKALQNYSGKPNIEDLFKGMNQNKYGGSIKEYGGPLVEFYKGKMTGPNIFANGGAVNLNSIIKQNREDRDNNYYSGGISKYKLGGVTSPQTCYDPKTGKEVPCKPGAHKTMIFTEHPRLRALRKNNFKEIQNSINAGEFTKEANDLKNYLIQNQPGEDIDIYPTYTGPEDDRIINTFKDGQLKPLNDILMQSTPNTRLAFMAHHGDQLFGQPYSELGKKLQATNYDNCYLGSCFSGDIAGSDQFKGLTNFHFRPGYPDYSEGTQGMKWLGVNPNKNSKTGEAGVNDAFFNTAFNYDTFLNLAKLQNVNDETIKAFVAEHKNVKNPKEWEKLWNDRYKLRDQMYNEENKISIIKNPRIGKEYSINNPTNQPHTGRSSNLFLGDFYNDNPQKYNTLDNWGSLRRPVKGYDFFEQGGQANRFFYNKGYGVPRFDDGGQGPCDPGYYYDVTAGKCLPLKATNLPLNTINEDETTTPIEQTSEEKRLALGLGDDASINESLKQGTAGSDNFLKNWYGQRTDDPRYGKVAQQRVAEIPKIQETPTTAADLKKEKTTAYYIQGGKKIYIDPNNPYSRGSTVQTHEKTHELYNQVPQPNQDNIIKNLIVGEKNWNKYLGDYKYYSDPTEVAARLNQFRKRYNIDPNKKYTPEEMRTIIDAHKNRYSSGVSIEDMNVDQQSGDISIDQLFNIIGDDPAKLAELNDRIVMNQQAAGADMAKWGGPTRMNKFGYLVDRKANGGSPYPINLNLPKYEQPKGFFTGYTYGNSPQANVNIYGVGAYGEKRVSPRMTLSGDISSQSVTYPGGSQMFNKPMYGVGMRYRFDNGGDISIPNLPNTKGPLLQFYYAKTGGELVGRSRKKA
jgi:hypothetical protein